MKKILALLLSLSVVFGLCACSATAKGGSNGSVNTGSVVSSIVSETSSEQTSESTTTEVSSQEDTVSTIVPEVTDKDESKVSSSKPSSSKPSSSKPTSSKTQTTSSQQTATKPQVNNAVHKAVAETSYYQFSCMDATEKKLYSRLNDSAQKFENYTDVSDLGLTVAEATSVMKRFVADHPQYFWISNQISVTYYVGSDVAEECIMKYSDGTVTDDLKDKKADRNVIKSKKAKVEAAAKEIVSHIDSKASDYEKELQIHDYLADNLKYDKDAEKTPTKDGTLKSAFDIYGALIDHKAICEGYTKSFQYLCYLVGINANQVVGKSHMWNVVKIGGDWYQVDLTRDDPIVNGGTIDIVTHDYFNLTTTAMSKDHKVDSGSYIKVPSCTATKYKYKK